MPSDEADVVLSASAEAPPGVAEVSVGFTSGKDRGGSGIRVNVLPPPPELPDELRVNGVGISGADAAGVAELAFVVVTQQQASDALAVVAFFGAPAADHQLLALHDFDLQPMG